MKVDGPSSHTAELRACALVARRELRFARQALHDAEKATRDLERSVEELIKGQAATAKDAATSLEQLRQRLTQLVDDRVVAATDTLSRKKKRLSKFTVTLFGRTMAGKSTLREALTGGDGSSIGKGGQRTTRDLREYRWQGLHLVDTPGIAAYRGKHDQELAVSVLDETDLVLFLTSSDGIQEDAFKGLAKLREQNKPVIFVLNMKRDLTKPVFMRRFLRDPKTVFGGEYIDGHRRRIAFLAERCLGMPFSQIVPIHAQAAFLATRPKHEAHAAALRRSSRMEDLLTAILSEIRTRGTVLRIRTIIDGTWHALSPLSALIEAEEGTLRDASSRIGQKWNEFDEWLSKLLNGLSQRIEAHVAETVAPLRASISRFVEDNIERSDVRDRWTTHVGAFEIPMKLEDFRKRVLSDIGERLDELGRDYEIDTTILQDFSVPGPDACDPADYRKWLRRTSAASAALAGVAAVGAWIGSTNFWNPVGWFAGAVSLVALGLSWFFGKREKQVAEGRRVATGNLQQQVDELAKRVIADQEKWANDELHQGILVAARGSTSALVGALSGLANELRQTRHRIDAALDALAVRLVTQCSHSLGSDLHGSDIISVRRAPGLITVVVTQNGRGCDAHGRTLSDALGEVVAVLHGGPKHEMVACALTAFGVQPDMVRTSPGGFTVESPRPPGDPSFVRLVDAARVVATALNCGIAVAEGSNHDKSQTV